MAASRLLLALLMASLAPPLMASDSEVQVMIGRDGPELDACGAIGKVARLDPEGDSFLSVRERPAPEAPEKDRLDARTLVWLCDSADEWQGIVYPSGDYQDLGDCRVGSPVRVAEPYAGPCRHGWVAAHYIELVAG